MIDVKSIAERKLLETSRRLSPEMMVELISYADALASGDNNKIRVLEEMRKLSEEAKRNSLTEDMLNDILREKS